MIVWIRSQKLIFIFSVIISIIALTSLLAMTLSGSLVFDDAYMFYRYAMNVRNGLGISWNPDGVHTYGLTSHAWLGVVLAFTFLPIPPAHALQLASWLIGVVALVSIFYGVAQRTFSEWSLAIASGGIAILAMLSQFTYHLTTGMDTMLAFGMNAFLLFLTINYLKIPSLRRAFYLGLVAFLAILIRPDNGVCALGSPVLAWMLQSGRRNYEDLCGLVLLPIILIATFVATCYIYYGVPLPLSFYAKSANSYSGFQGQGSSVRYLFDFLVCVVPFLLIIALVGIRRKFIAVFFVPVLITVVYLLTVNQVMGWRGRFYIPLLPFIVIPTLLSLDEFLKVHRKPTPGRTLFTIGVAISCIAIFAARDWIVESHLRASLSEPIAIPTMPIAANKRLPEIEWFENISRISDDVAKELPEGSVVAASEVGYLGLSAPHVKIIDLVGLNDLEIGKHGVNVNRLIERAPDLIWLPHTHYTGIRADLLSSHHFHENYMLIDGAYNYGLAIRRNSPRRSQIEEIIQRAWLRTYSSRRLEDYLANTSHSH